MLKMVDRLIYFVKSFRAKKDVAHLGGPYQQLFHQNGYWKKILKRSCVLDVSAVT